MNWLKRIFDFHTHQWEFLRVTHYDDVSWGYCEPSTEAYFQCKVCAELKCVNYYGEIWEAPELKRMAENGRI